MGYSNYTLLRLRIKLGTAAEVLAEAEEIMKAAGETVERINKLETIRRKLQKLTGRLLDGVE